MPEINQGLHAFVVRSFVSVKNLGCRLAFTHPKAPQLAPDADGFIWMPDEGFASAEQIALSKAVQRPISIELAAGLLPDKHLIIGNLCWRTYLQNLRI